MVFSRFRRPNAELRVELSKRVALPGDEIEARVSLIPKSDFHVREGKVELVMMDTYIQRVQNQYGASYHKRTNDEVIASETLMGDGAIRGGVTYSSDFRFVVPEGALPTLNGAEHRKIQPGIAWAVKASLDVASARDLSENGEFVVRPTEPDDEPANPTSVEESHRQCILELSLSQGKARSGDRISGVLKAETLRDVKVEDVRVELARIEKFGDEDNEITVSQVIVTEDVSLPAEQTMETSFDLDVGQVSVPTLKTEKSEVRWVVKGILSRNLQTDLRVEAEISVGV